MSNRKLVLSALALILGVIGSVAWYLFADAAEQRALREERRPPVVSPSLTERPTSVLRGANGRQLLLGAALVSDCPCLESGRG